MRLRSEHTPSQGYCDYTGDSLRRLRKASGTSQIELAKILSVHQSAISRIENSEQEISVSQLVLASRYFGVDATAIINGRINYWGVSERFNQESLLPKPYRSHIHSKVRELVPFISYLNKVRGEQFVLDLFAQFNLESLLFANGEQPISSYCLFDLIRYLLCNHYLDTNDLGELVQCTLSEKFHETLYPLYRAQTIPLHLIQSFLVNMPYYGDEFQFEIISLTSGSLTVTRQRNEALNTVLNKDHLLDQFLCRYHCQMIQKIPQIIGGSPTGRISVAHESQTEGHERCMLTIHC